MSVRSRVSRESTRIHANKNKKRNGAWKNPDAISIWQRFCCSSLFFPLRPLRPLRCMPLSGRDGAGAAEEVVLVQGTIEFPGDLRGFGTIGGCATPQKHHHDD